MQATQAIKAYFPNIYNMNLGGIALFPYHLQWAPYGLVFSLPTLIIPAPYKIEIFFATFCFITCYSIS